MHFICAIWTSNIFFAYKLVKGLWSAHSKTRCFVCTYSRYVDLLAIKTFTFLSKSKFRPSEKCYRKHSSRSNFSTGRIRFSLPVASIFLTIVLANKNTFVATARTDVVIYTIEPFTCTFDITHFLHTLITFTHLAQHQLHNAVLSNNCSVNWHPLKPK